MGKSSKKKAKSRVSKTRKELRKDKRLQKKENKRNFFSNRKSKQMTVKPKREWEHVIERDAPAEGDSNNEIESDFELSDDELNSKLIKINKASGMSKAPAQTDRFLENQMKEKKKEKDLRKQMKKRRLEQLKDANEEDEKIIRRLEKKLKIDKHKNNKSVHKMFNDGLDYALELCLPESIEKMYKAAKDVADSQDSEEEFEEDLADAIGEDNPKKEKSPEKRKKSDQRTREVRLAEAEAKHFKGKIDVSGSDSELDSDNVNEKPAEEIRLQDSEDSDFDILGDEDNDQGNQESNVEDTANEDSDIHPDETDVNEIEDSYSRGENQDNARAEDKALWEDIYGRTRDQSGQVLEQIKSSKYVPPHVRMRLEAEQPCDSKRKERLVNLQRHCKGFLNRLSEANVIKIASEIERLYLNNSRFDMNNTLTKLVSEAIISNVLTAERMVLEYAMLISILHANVGSEIGAHFLETFVVKIDTYIEQVDKLAVEDKHFDNTLFFLCHMYTFKIFQHSIIYGVITRLCENLCEKVIECLLLILRSVGFQLRKDDPLALKNFIILIQKKANAASQQIKENPRCKFMLEVLLAIKNNNMNKITQYDPSLAEHLKKILKSTMTNGKYIATLNITMEDLLNADQKGKWWVVGSAWTGNLQDMKTAKQMNKQEGEKFSDQLLMLAKQQRMNTNDRKSVFCIIMSAEDYLNAFEKLLQLAIKDQRVIPTVIIHCCLSEKQFNPYYGALAEKFCEYDRKYQLAIQFALWDRIKEIHSASKQEVSNLAHLLIYLIGKGGQPLSVLKVIEFGELDKVTLRFVRQIILGLLLGNEEQCRTVFTRIAPSAKLGLFKDSLRLFMNHFLLKQSKQNIDTDKVELLKIRIKIADENLQSTGSTVKF